MWAADLRRGFITKDGKLPIRNTPGLPKRASGFDGSFPLPVALQEGRRSPTPLAAATPRRGCGSNKKVVDARVVSGVVLAAGMTATVQIDPHRSRPARDPATR